MTSSRGCFCEWLVTEMDIGGQRMTCKKCQRVLEDSTEDLIASYLITANYIRSAIYDMTYKGRQHEDKYLDSLDNHAKAKERLLTRLKTQGDYNRDGTIWSVKSVTEGAKKMWSM